VDATDNGLLDANKTGSPTEAQLAYDLDGDGDVDNDDDTLHGTLTGSDYRRPGRAFSGVGNDRLFTMQTLDAEMLNYHYKARWYLPHEERFGQIDPIFHVDTASHANTSSNAGRTYSVGPSVSPRVNAALVAKSNGKPSDYSLVNPISTTDPSGMLSIDPTHIADNCYCTDWCNSPAFDEGVAAANCAMSSPACSAWMNANGCGPPQTAYLKCCVGPFDWAMCLGPAGGGGYVVRGTNTIQVCPGLWGQDPAYIASILLHEAIHTCGRLGHGEDTAEAGQQACQADIVACLP
jgi:hypothetical protein